MKLYITTLVAVLFVSCFCLPCFAACPSMDATGDCCVDFKNFAKTAEQWLAEGIPTPILNGITWVSINDPGIGGIYFLKKCCYFVVNGYNFMSRNE